MPPSATATISSSDAFQVHKRNGAQVDYDRRKITQAIRLCLINDCSRPDNDETVAVTEKITDRVHTLLKTVRKTTTKVTVELIQDLVEQTLMDMGLHEEARSYILYRAEHKKHREKMPVDPKTREVFAEGLKHFTGRNPLLQQIQAFDKFSQWDDSLGRREVWPESCDRVIGFFKSEMDSRGMSVPAEQWKWLHDGLLTMKAAPSMRCVQLGGRALERDNLGVFNCSYLVMDSTVSMAEDLYLLMQGCGVGFSVENELAVEKWGRVKRQKGGPARTMIVDDTTEAWCDTIKYSYDAWMDGEDVVHDTSLVRPEGSPLKTKGGTASGPGPLLDLLAFARQKFLSRQGSYLTSLDINDIACYQHRIVQMGGVRRASGINLSDLLDALMRDCKSGNFWQTNPQRNQANNSTAYNEKPTMEQFMAEWQSLMLGYSGERGIFNRQGAVAQMPLVRQKTLTAADKRRIGTNPCGEIILRDRGLCNLSIGVIRPDDDFAAISEKVKLATAFGTLQSALTRFSYVRSDWAKNADAERLLGVDMLGFLDNKLIGPRSEADRGPLLRALQVQVWQDNAEWAKMLGINPSLSPTCNKPSGDSSVFYDTAAGFKPHHGEYFIRRLRMKPGKPITRLLQDAGVPWVVDYDGSGLIVFEIPCVAPVDNPILMPDMPAIRQLEEWRLYKKNWTTHNPSTTVYVKNEEWMAVGAWVWENWEIVGGLSFLPYDGGIYRLAPYETITQDEYRQRKASLPDVEWSKLTRYEIRDSTELRQALACAGGACTI